jgi:hypothetical protein
VCSFKNAILCEAKAGMAYTYLLLAKKQLHAIGALPIQKIGFFCHHFNRCKNTISV